MSQLRVSRIRRKVKNHLDRERYEHTLGVMYTAGALAMCHGSDLEQALIAGLLHDCAKCIPDEKKLRLCDRYHLNVSDVEAANPGLLHARLGAFLAGKKYRINDLDIINAIACHTTGRPEMTLLDKIIYIADYIEPGRYGIAGLDQYRSLAFKDLDQCLFMILEGSLKYVQSKDQMVDPMTEKTYRYYQRELGSKREESEDGTV